MVTSNFLQTPITYLMYVNETIYVEEVATTLLLEERRLSGENTETTDVSALAIGRKINLKRKESIGGEDN